MTAGHQHILVVEDDPETAGQLAESLTTSRYEVSVADNGSDALNLGLSSAYTVITMEDRKSTRLNSSH